MESLNRMALELVDEAIDFADELAITVHEVGDGATILDFGVDAEGGIEAGLLLAEIQTAGLATVQTRLGEVAGTPLTHVELTTDHPALALLCSAKAGWELSVDEFEGLGSGPARALVAGEDVFDRVGYRDEADFATLTVETDALPGEPVVESVAKRTGVGASAVSVAAFRTASIAGSVSIAARAGELAVFRLAELGYDPRAVLSVAASAPVAPVAADEAAAMARTNDGLAYGGRVHLIVDEPFDRFNELPSTARAEYGLPFADIFEDVDWEFYDLDPSVFAPAQVTIDVVGGPTHVEGEVDESLLAESYGLTP